MYTLLIYEAVKCTSTASQPALRRICIANELFGYGVCGWKNDVLLTVVAELVCGLQGSCGAQLHCTYMAGVGCS